MTNYLALLSILIGLSTAACNEAAPPARDSGADLPTTDRASVDTRPTADQGPGSDQQALDGQRTDGPGADQGVPATGPCVATAGGSTYDYGRDVVLDGAGNSFITGTFSGTATFGSTVLTADGSQDAFVAKLDASCKFVWAVALSGPDVEEANGIARDSAGNLYVVGDFGPSLSCGSKTLVSQGESDIYVAKLDASGAVKWCISGGGTDFDHGTDIQLDAADNIYLLGDYRAGDAMFGSFTVTNQGNYDVVVAKLNPSGSFLWATSAGGATEDRASGLAADNTGAYITGFFTGSATFGTESLTALGGRDGYVAKVDASGNLSWATPFSGTADEWGNAIALDGAGGLYVTGNVQSSTTTFGSIVKTSTYGLGFVAKLAIAGSFSWVATFGGAETETSNALAVDSAGNSIIAGYYGKEATFGTIKVTSPSSDTSEIFVAKLDPTGQTFLWAKGAAGSGWDSAISIALDKAGQSHVVGFFSGNVTFGSQSLKAAGGGNDIFMAKLSAGGDI